MKETATIIIVVIVIVVVVIVAVTLGAVFSAMYAVSQGGRYARVVGKRQQYLYR